MRTTTRLSPRRSRASSLASSGRARSVPLAFSSTISAQPADCNATSWGARSCPSALTRAWPCPGLTDTPDRLNGLRGVDGGEQQTAAAFSGRVQARGGGGDPRRPLGFGGGGRAWPAGPAGAGLAALGGGAHGGRE